MTIRCGKKTIAGKIAAPPSKSSMQRAVACAVLAEGKSRLRGGILCDDSVAALRVAEALGASVDIGKESIAIGGSPLFAGNFPDRRADVKGTLDLDCGESGLC
ncbi:MAG TPA: hypothetical protein VN437_07385, partial [Rectinemataceae bacterium]|nr:hypothetical protein [Rectinemataceae bacterium]